MNEIITKALHKWALFCVNHNSESTAESALNELFGRNYAEHYLGKLRASNYDWNSLICTMDEENIQILIEHILDKR